jgi:signal peptidase II
VTDFLEVRLWTYIWPAFNVADSAITIGAIFVLFELLVGSRQQVASTERGRR